MATARQRSGDDGTVVGMCGRYVASTPSDVLADYLDADEVRSELPPANWNVAPTDPVAAVVNRGGQRLLGPMSWGLVPSWATDRTGAARMINARAETLATKPAFRSAFSRRRCLIPADGFYEWERRSGGPKRPWFIHRADGAPMVFAGIWEAWRPPEQRRPKPTPGQPRDEAKDDRPPPLRTCSIITTTANADLTALHDRMPVLIDPVDWADWLDPDNDDIDQLGRLLGPADQRLLDRYPVATLVNRVANNGPELIEPDDSQSADAKSGSAAAGPEQDEPLTLFPTND
jgi:putative SOS response-associated peptidase YedK